MYSISSSQIRAARGLLDWTQHDLAAASNVSRGTIKAIENGEAVRADKVLVVQKTLMHSGIEFLQGDGVKRQPDGLMDYAGFNSCDNFFADMVATLKDKGGELLCVIESQGMLTRVSGSTRRTNLERLEDVHRITGVKCLITDDLEISSQEPSFDIRVMLRQATIMPMSVFVYDNQWVCGFQNSQMNFTFAAFQNPTFLHGAQSYFSSHWQISGSLFPLSSLQKRSA